MEKLTKREGEILDLIKINPTISREIIAKKLGISNSAVGTHLHNLTRKGYLLGRGYIIAPKEEVVVIGGSNIDLKGYTKNYSNYTSNPGRIIESLGGVGRNIAENLGILERQVTLLTAVGNDHYGKTIVTQTGNSGVNMDFVKEVEDKKTGIYLAHLDQQGELIGAISDREIFDEINCEYLEEHIQILRQSSLIVIDANLKHKSIKYILDTIKEDNLKVLIEPVSYEKTKKIKPFLGEIDYITPNLGEAEILFGLDVWRNKELDIRQQRLEDAYNQITPSPKMIITCGDKGVWLLTEKKSRFLAAANVPKNEIKESTGAGDALTAGLIEGLLSGENLKEAVILGMKAAEITLNSEGTVNPNLASEIESYRKNQY